jgi:hypothetical protein
LVLEDDAFVCPRFAERYDLLSRTVPDDWEQVYLGGQFPDELPPPIAGDDSIVVPWAVLRTHAYILRASAYNRVLSMFGDPDWILCVDKWHIDGMYRVLHESRMMRVYAPIRWLVGQDEFPSDVQPGVMSGPRYWNKEALACQP